MTLTTYILTTATVLLLNGKIAFKMQETQVPNSQQYTSKQVCDEAAASMTQIVAPNSRSVDAAGQYTSEDRVFCKEQKQYVAPPLQKARAATVARARNVKPERVHTHASKKKAKAHRK
ncbi:hypothetical protein BcepSauron_153 [Burkholderia phage BcepSauron]|uniref:Uncharacterized protein n=1 Tax=Burkholderia phage BcepSauron TaxID=2530033 RepID=A0A482MN00_9CAUD|nr:hypothetical protein H1O17_gp153 [Burkholderia phage BcepSauron]QBQ74533.1 hypothetical protein BcepSauron_153 [Burkholderia phage BcepSauron]